MRIFGSLIVFVFVVVQISACGGGNNSGGASTQANASPAAIAGPDQIVDEQTVVSLLGSGVDLDGTITKYLWEQIIGEGVVLSDTTIASPKFNAPDTTSPLTLTFKLTVRDNEGATGSDTVTVTVNPVNATPTVDAGDHQNVVEGDEVTLNASSFDSDGEVINYSWSQIVGSPVVLENADTAMATFVAPFVSNVAETLSFRVRVTDNESAVASDTVEIEISETPKAVLGKLNDTGITLCGDYAYDAASPVSSNNLDCKNTIDANGDPVPAGQDGHGGHDISHNDDSDGHAGFSFTKLDANGAPLSADALEWSCVRDNITGLVWEVKTSIGGLQNGDNTYTWYNPDPGSNGGSAGSQNGGSCSASECDTKAYVAAINDLRLCGADDWNLPDSGQLRSIVDYSVDYPGPTIDGNYFPNTKHGYWSSDVYSYYTSRAWLSQFDLGFDFNAEKSNGHYVRLVRGGY